MATFDELKEKVKKHLNELILDDISGTRRLLGIYNAQEDYYWIFLTRKKIVLVSCLCSWIPLKGYLKDEDYYKLERIWNLNIQYDENKIQEQLKLLNRKSKLKSLNDETFYKF